MSLLHIENLNVELRQRRRRIDLLSDVSLSVDAGEVCALVGESGAGKSMLARTVLDLLPESARILSGTVHFNGVDLAARSSRKRRQIFGREISLIPQDPMVSLNPVRRISDQMMDVMRIRLGLSREQSEKRCHELLDEVMIREPKRVLKAYAHELSGGMRQRLLIAMAFSTRPKLIIADEPTTALDVTVQRRVLSLLRVLQERHKTAILFVTHDLGVVAKLCDRIVVMREGRIVESGTVETVFSQASHEYTRALMAATPRYDQPESAFQWEAAATTPSRGAGSGRST